MQGKSSVASGRFLRRNVFSAGVTFLVLFTAALAMILNGCGGGSTANTQISTPPPITTPSVVSVTRTTCSPHFFSDLTTPATCYTANLAGCANASPLNFMYSVDVPATTPQGTIVLLSGGSGVDDTGDIGSADFYFNHGFEVIQVEWSYDWEVTNAPAGFNGGGPVTTYPANVQVAACRQATFLNYVFNSNNTNLYSSGGRCAEGGSAGSGAIAYALTFYGAGSYLDAVELKSGPPIADFQAGCEEPPAPDVTICGTQNGKPQVGCQLGGSSSWTLSPTYSGAANGVRTWTNDSSCAQTGSTTSSSSNAAWLAQSIVNGGTPTGVYSYPHTAMSAWLCQSVNQQTYGPCTGGNTYGQGGLPENSCPNNSSSQAEIYYAKLTSDPNNLPDPSLYHVYAVQNCVGPEGVNDTTTTVPALGTNGQDAIEQDMLTQCVPH